MDVVKLDWDIAYDASVSFVSDVCCKCFDLYVACVTHMLQEYVANVSFLCCSKYFYVANVLSGCYVTYVSHMLQVYVSNVLSASDLCYIKCFMLQVF
jgi:hypothetical protein